jgi:antitoxin ParD1/3/4
MAARNVSLTVHLASFVDQRVTSGRHQNASEVVRDALCRYKSELAAQQACIEMIHGIAREGHDAIGCGEYALIDGSDARDALFRRVTGRIDPKPASVRRRRPRQPPLSHAWSGATVTLPS